MHVKGSDDTGKLGFHAALRLGKFFRRRFLFFFRQLLILFQSFLFISVQNVTFVSGLIAFSFSPVTGDVFKNVIIVIQPLVFIRRHICI